MRDGAPLLSAPQMDGHVASAAIPPIVSRQFQQNGGVLAACRGPGRVRPDGRYIKVGGIYVHTSSGDDWKASGRPFYKVLDGVNQSVAPADEVVHIATDAPLDFFVQLLIGPRALAGISIPQTAKVASPRRPLTYIGLRVTQADYLLDQPPLPPAVISCNVQATLPRGARRNCVLSERLRPDIGYSVVFDSTAYTAADWASCRSLVVRQILQRFAVRR